MSEKRKKRSRFLNEDELDALELTSHNYVESWTEAMESFLRDRELRGLRSATLFHYSVEMKYALQYLQEQQLDHIKPYELTKKHIEANIILYMKNVKNLSPATINVRLRALKTVINWLCEKNMLPSNPADGVKKLKTRVAEVVAMTNEQLIKFFRCIDKSTWTGVRDYATCLVLLECGLRQNELLNVEVTDIVWEQNYILVKHTKTYRMRKVPITEETKKALKRWITVRGEAAVNQLFCNIAGERFTARGLYQMINKYAKKAKIEGIRVSPHVFRHTMAKLYLKNSGDLFSLQQILGHADISMTRRYIQFMHEDVAELHKKYSPIKNLKL